MHDQLLPQQPNDTATEKKTLQGSTLLSLVGKIDLQQGTEQYPARRNTYNGTIKRINKRD